jgi:hypothetical protein
MITTATLILIIITTVMLIVFNPRGKTARKFHKTRTPGWILSLHPDDNWGRPLLDRNLWLKKIMLGTLKALLRILSAIARVIIISFSRIKKLLPLPRKKPS